MLIVIIRLQNILNQQIVVKKIVDVDCWVCCIEMEKNHSKKEDGRMNVMCKCFKTWMNRESSSVPKTLRYKQSIYLLIKTERSKL